MAVFEAEALKFATGLDFTGLKRDTGRALKSFGTFGAKAAKVLAPVAKGLATVGAAIKGMTTALGVGAVQTGAQFEQLQTRLSTLLGSAEAGAARLEDIFAFASSTPFELNELVEAEVNLRALGVEAEKALPMVMDFAGAMGTDLTSAAVEVGRAMQFGAGAVESISGRALRAQVELRTGQDALKMSTQQFREELVKTLTDADGIFAGGTTKLAKTFQGLVSNLQDQWTGFQKQVADAGLFAGVKAALGVTLELLGENKVGVARLADAVSMGLVESLKAVISAGGMMIDGWTLLQASALGWEILLQEALQVVYKLQLGGMGLVNLAREKLGLEKAYVSELLVVHNKVLDTEAAITGARAEVFELAKGFGAGSEAAERMNTAIDQAVTNARALGKATGAVVSGSAPAGSGSAPAAPTGDGGGTTALEKWAEEQKRILRGVSGNFEQEFGTIEGLFAKLEENWTDWFDRNQGLMERGFSGFMGAFDSFVGERIAGEKSLGESLRGLTLELFADLLRELAKFFTLQAAAFFATGRFAAGGLRLAGAAAATAGAATMQAAGQGALFHDGGRGEDRMGRLAPDEYPATLRRNEEVVSEQDSASIKDILRQLRDGGMGGGVARMVYQHADLNRVLGDNLRLPGSPLNLAFAEGSIPGVRP